MTAAANHRPANQSRTSLSSTFCSVPFHSIFRFFRRSNFFFFFFFFLSTRTVSSPFLPISILWLSECDFYDRAQSPLARNARVFRIWQETTLAQITLSGALLCEKRTRRSVGRRSGEYYCRFGSSCDFRDLMHRIPSGLVAFANAPTRPLIES